MGKTFAESGVAGYIYTKATVRMQFPIDYNGEAFILCANCKFFDKYKKVCHLNNEITEFPDKYIGSRCPLQIDEEEEEKN